MLFLTFYYPPLDYSMARQRREIPWKRLLGSEASTDTALISTSIILVPLPDLEVFSRIYWPAKSLFPVVRTSPLRTKKPNNLWPRSQVLALFYPKKTFSFFDRVNHVFRFAFSSFAAGISAYIRHGKPMLEAEDMPGAPILATLKHFIWLSTVWQLNLISILIV